MPIGTELIDATARGTATFKDWYFSEDKAINSPSSLEGKKLQNQFNF